MLSSAAEVDLLAAQTALVGTGLFSAAELPTRAATSTPSPAELQAHDAVLFWSDAPWDDAAALGDTLADYVDAGGAVVLAAPALLVGGGPAGRFAAGAYSPVAEAASGPVAGDVDLAASDAAHPALSGLVDVRFPDVAQGNPTLAPSGESVAVDSAGNLVLASVCDRSVLALNLHPPDLALGEPLVSADAALLLAQTLLATGQDALPIAAVGGPYTVDEGGSLVLDAGLSDPGDLGPITWDWDLDDDGLFDDASGPTAPFDAGSLDGPSAAPVAVQVTDRCGRSVGSSAAVLVANVAPELSALSFSPAGSVAELLSFSVLAEDPVDPVQISWTWGDEEPDGAGEHPSHAWSSPGTFALTVLAEDDDGGVATATSIVTITNPGPDLALVSAAGPLDEGEVGAFEVTAVDAFGADVEVAWSFGDGQPDEAGVGLVAQQRGWADDGLYLLVIVATDGFGDAAQLSLEVQVDNVAPSPDSTPPMVGAEDELYATSLTAADPGDDPLLWSLLSGPAGLVLASDGAVSWTPAFAQGGATHGVQALVQDGDGGSATQTWTVAVAWTDADGDGLPDTWETAVGLDPAVDDADEDLDGDGRSNAEEYAAGTPPATPNVPGAPTPLSPASGATLDTATPELRVLAAGDPDGDALTYGFEVYGDPSLTLLVSASSGVLPLDGEAAWVPSVPLAEDAPAWWRARASDAFGDGPWTGARSLHVDATNAPPPLPVVLSPDGSTVATPTVLLRAVSWPDPEGDAIELVFRVYSDELLHELDAVVSGDAWEAVVPEPLDDDVDYSWTAEAMDARGGLSGETQPAMFHLDASNQAPPAPVLLDPLEGSETSAARPAWSADIGPDPDGDPLLVRVQLSRGPDFEQAEALALLAPSDGLVEVAPLDDLLENAEHWLRARSEDDRGGASPWVIDHGFVNAAEEPPGVPTIIEPLPEAVVEPQDLLVRWAITTDPDRDELVYQLRLADDADDEDGSFWSVQLPSPHDGVELAAAVDASLAPGGYRAFVRAVDSSDLPGPWASTRFVVAAPEPRPALDLGPGVGGGWTCAHTPGGGVLLALLTGAVRRRRRVAR